MTLELPLLLKGVVLGLGAAVPIGPVNVQIARRALRGGFVPAFTLGLGAVTVDVAYAVLSSLGLRGAGTWPVVEWVMRVGGTALLAYLGTMCLRGEREAWRGDRLADRLADRLVVTVPPGPASTRYAGDYLTGLLMTLLNPMTVAFWFVAVPALTGSITPDPARDLPAVCAGVFLGTLAWVVFFATLLAVAGRYRRPWWLAAADAVGGASLLFFAATALVGSLKVLVDP